MNYDVLEEQVKQDIEALVKERERIDARIVLLKRLMDVYTKLRVLTTGTPVEEVPVVELLKEAIDAVKKSPDMPKVVDAINAVPAEPGITNAIRQVLLESKIPLSTSEIKAGLEKLGVNLSEYVNSSAVVYNTLTRLEKQHEVIRVQNPAGQTVAYTLVKNSMYRRLYELA